MGCAVERYIQSFAAGTVAVFPTRVSGEVSAQTRGHHLSTSLVAQFIHSTVALLMHDLVRRRGFGCDSGDSNGTRGWSLSRGGFDRCEGTWRRCSNEYLCQFSGCWCKVEQNTAHDVDSHFIVAVQLHIGGGPEVRFWWGQCFRITTGACIVFSTVEKTLISIVQ